MLSIKPGEIFKPEVEKFEKDLKKAKILIIIYSYSIKENGAALAIATQP
jgi:hypothetical protein